MTRISRRDLIAQRIEEGKTDAGALARFDAAQAERRDRKVSKGPKITMEGPPPGHPSYAGQAGRAGHAGREWARGGQDVPTSRPRVEPHVRDLGAGDLSEVARRVETISASGMAQAARAIHELAGRVAALEERLADVQAALTALEAGVGASEKRVVEACEEAWAEGFESGAESTETPGTQDDTPPQDDRSRDVNFR